MNPQGQKKPFWKFSFKDVKAAFLRFDLDDHTPRYSNKYLLWSIGIAGTVLISISGIFGFYIVNGKLPSMATSQLLGIAVGLFLGINWTAAKYSIKENSGLKEEKPDIQPPDLKIEKGWEGFDPEAPDYPEQLDIAMQAWRAVSMGKSEGAIKEQLIKWVKANYPALSTNSIDRIATVANWDKVGGRPKQNP